MLVILSARQASRSGQFVRERLTYRDAYSKTPMWTNRANAACPNFRLELKKSSVREVYVYVLVKKEEGGGGE